MPLKIRCPECGTPGAAPDSAAGMLVSCPNCAAQFEAVDEGKPVRKRGRKKAAKRMSWSFILLLCGGVLLGVVTTGVGIAITLSSGRDESLLTDPVLEPDRLDFSAEDLHRLTFNDYRGVVAESFNNKAISLIGKDVTVTGYFQGPITQETGTGKTVSGYGISAGEGGHILIWCNSVSPDLAKLAGSERRIRGHCRGSDRPHGQIVLNGCTPAP